MKHQPSRVARQILHWFVNAEFVEEVEGDLDELFYERLSSHRWLKVTSFTTSMSYRRYDHPPKGNLT